MRYSKLTLLLSLLAALSLTATGILPAAAHDSDDQANNRPLARQQVKIDYDGKVQLEGVKVTTVSPSISAISLPAAITATSTWGATVFTWNIKTSGETKFVRYPTTGSAVNQIDNQINVGDMLSVKGALDMTQTAPTVNASWIKDWSTLPIRKLTLRGTITDLDTDNLRFMLTDPSPRVDRAPITVQASTSTTIKRGDAEISFNGLANGEAVSVSGTFNSSTTTLFATEINVKAPKPQVWHGVLKSIAGTTKPTNLVVTIGGSDHNVSLGADTAVLDFWWNWADLKDFVVGHRLQIFGTPFYHTLPPNLHDSSVFEGQYYWAPGPLPTIAATVVRNLNLR